MKGTNNSIIMAIFCFVVYKLNPCYKPNDCAIQNSIILVAIPHQN